MGEPSALSNRARRRFLGALGGAALAVGLARGAGVVELARAAQPGAPASDRRRWGLLVDVTKCASGCEACVRACDEEHGILGTGRPGTDAQWIREVTLRHRESGSRTTLPLMCQHCRDAPCVAVCPTGASFERSDGIVLVDKHLCIGCRYCMLACPFNARSFIHEALDSQKPHAPRGKGTVESCTLCVHRIDEGEGRATACAQACTEAGHGAIVFGDLNDPESAVSVARRARAGRELRPDLALDTSVRYYGL